MILRGPSSGMARWRYVPDTIGYRRMLRRRPAGQFTGSMPPYGLDDRLNGAMTIRTGEAELRLKRLYEAIRRVWPI